MTTTKETALNLWQMIIAKDLLTYDVLYDFIIVAKSRSGKIGTKTV